MEQRSVSKLEKEHGKSICYLDYTTYMQISSCERVGWMAHKLESRLLGEMSATSGTSLMAENEEDLKTS